MLVAIAESKVIKEGYFGMNSFVQYKLETRVSVLKYSNDVYRLSYQVTTRP